MPQEKQHIFFGKSVNTRDFESLLKRHYKDSLRSDHVCFDFSQVEWCETPELSLVVLWICELLERGVLVSFTLPAEEPLDQGYLLPPEEQTRAIERRVNVYSHLAQSRFLDFLVTKEILKDTQFSSRRLTKTVRPIEDGITPLAFFNTAQDFLSFIEMLRGPNYQSYFAKLTEIPVLKTGEVRDTILQELGQNIFDHAQGRFGHMIMTFRNPLDLDTNGEIALKARINSSPKTTRQFFRELGPSGYLIIVVADKGPGIDRKLRNSYHKDDFIARREERPSEAKIIDYAFLPHSTSKSREERMGALSSLLENRADSVPPTGLFSVMEFVKQYRGLLIVRSGHSMVTYDFLSYPDTGHPSRSLLTNKFDSGLRTLSRFGGTQIRIYFPIKVKHKSRFMQMPKQPEVLPSTQRRHIYQPIIQMPTEPLTDQSKDFANWLLNVRDQLHRALYSAQEPTVIILDCENCETRSTTARKTLFMLLKDAIRLQNEKRCIVLVNVPPSLMELGFEMQRISASTSGVLSDKALLVFDQQSKMSMIGLSDEESKQLLKRLYSTSNSADSTTLELADNLLPRIQHLIAYNPSSDMYELIASRITISQQIKDNLKEGLATYIIDGVNGIYHKTGCFMLPSGAYSEGYFELRHLFDNADMKQKLARLVRHIVELSQADDVISLGKSLGIIIEEAIRGTGINHINIQEPRKHLSAIQVSLLPKSHKLLIITDVIGTQRTIDIVLESCEKFEVKRIFSLVDARLTGEAQPDVLISGGRTYSLESILRCPLRFWHEDKPSHYMYEEIKRVDPISNASIEEPFLPDRPIWTQMNEVTGENEFLEKILRDTNALVIGHFESNQRHLLYLFLLAEVTHKYKAVITETIRDDLKRLQDKGFPKSITHIFYPKHTPAADQVATLLSVAVGGESIGLTPQEIEFPLSFPWVNEPREVAIIFDDASSTGQTTQQMLELVESRGFLYILIYILCNRAGRLRSNHIHKISSYGKAKVVVKHLTELNIPTYSKTDCPKCYDIVELTSVQKEVGHIALLGQIVAEQIEQRRVQKVSTVLEPGNVRVFQSTPLDDRISEAKLRTQIELARTSLLSRKGLSDIAEKHKDMPDIALKLIRVIFREKVAFQRDQEIWDGVFYDNLRRRLIDACAFFLDNWQRLLPSDVHCVAGIFSALDPDRLLNHLETIIHKIDEVTLSRVIVEMLRSERLIDRANYLAQVLRMHSNSTTIAPLIDYLEARVQDSSRGGGEAYKVYSKLRILLEDSGSLAHLFLHLSTSNLKHGSSDCIKDKLGSFWQEASSLLRKAILPRLQELASSDVAISTCDKLGKLCNEAAGIVNICDDLAVAMIDESKSQEDRKHAQSGFSDGLRRLEHLLVDDDKDTVWQCFGDLYSNLIRVIRISIEDFKSDLQAKDIHLECEWLENSALVFGHLPNVYVITSILFDNVVKHAFDGSEKPSGRLMRIKVSEDSKTFTLTISDNGKGLPCNFRFGVGLSNIDSMCHKFCHSWTPPKQAEYPYITETKVMFYKFRQEKDDE